jgi:mannose-6-phosphate isomerase-like protein (cupin superfamily)
MMPIALLPSFERIDEYWSPKVIAQVNDHYLKAAKLKGRFVWHEHADEDELFYLLKGRLVIEYEEGSVTLQAGEIHVVPKGKRHCPVAEEECWVVLFEPVGTAHTGATQSDLTRSIEDQLA